MSKKTLTDAAQLLEQAALILSANYFRVEAERVATMKREIEEIEMHDRAMFARTKAHLIDGELTAALGTTGRLKSATLRSKMYRKIALAYQSREVSREA